MLLNGSELAGYIKAQQAQAVRSLQHTGRVPRLAIIACGMDTPSRKYVELKQRYGDDIGVSVEVLSSTPDELEKTIEQVNTDALIHGAILQLPVPKGVDVDRILNQIKPEKDVDGLGKSAQFVAATPTAILWLLSAYNVELLGQQVGVIGQGRLVGSPLIRILEASGVAPMVVDKEQGSLSELMATCTVVITATGQPGLITPDLVRAGQVIIDAGTASEGGSLVGDVDPKLYEREDIKVSPVPGGVGPLTVCALFANMIEAFKRQVLV